MDDFTFLSVRVPRDSKRHIKQIAARKGMSDQELVGGLVDDLVERETRTAPSLADAVARLRDEKPGLRKLGVEHIDLFGSVVRNQADRESDIDLVVEFKQRLGMTLSKFASLRNRLETILGHRVDLAESRTLKPEVRQAYRRDALRVF